MTGLSLPAQIAMKRTFIAIMFPIAGSIICMAQDTVDDALR